MEKVQKKSYQIGTYLCGRAYDNYFVELNLKDDMIMIYQLLHHNLNIEPSDVLNLNSSLSLGVTISNCIYNPRASSRVRSSFFTVRAISDWNSLFHTVVTAPSINLFKNLLVVAGLRLCTV